MWPFGLPIKNGIAAAKAGPWRVAVVGGGRLGQYYAEAFCAFADTELVAVVERGLGGNAALPLLHHRSAALY